MITSPKFKQKLAAVDRLWEAGNFDGALAKVEALLEAWPGNAHLHVLWASLVQLQESSEHGLDQVKSALRDAAELDPESPAAAIELGHFVDNVEDNPQAATKIFGEAVAGARRLLAEALIGQAKALLQIGKRDEAFSCLAELLQLARFDRSAKRAKEEDSWVVFFAREFLSTHSQSAFAEQIRDLLSEATAEPTGNSSGDRHART